MPALIPTKKFLEDIERFRKDKTMRKKLAKALNLLQGNPFYPGLHAERIVNDPSAWAIRVDRRYRISFEPESYLEPGTPDWSGNVLLLRLLSHDDLYKRPR
jgi:mRNA-degrading endonuclease RelE of RelBE toxin-antitoxin system